MTSSLRHQFVSAPGARIHVAELGAGPLVLFVHGFPDGWWSWRHQLPAIAAAGFRAAAIDLRGYGRSSAPAAVDAYRMLAQVADVVAVARALGDGTATIIGHDLGSPIAAAAALLRPDVFTAVGLMGVPYTPPGGPRPSEAFAAVGGDEEFYVSYFQMPGRAESEIEPDVRGWLAGFYAALAGEAAPGVFTIPPGGRMRDRFPPLDELPDWLSEAELDAAAREFEPAGPLNRYRNFDRDWEDLAAWQGEPLRQPSIFIAGAQDASTVWLADAIAAQATTLPGLVSSHLLEGCGHWVHQERPAEVNDLLVRWLNRT